jgi:hypothetical protein
VEEEEEEEEEEEPQRGETAAATGAANLVSSDWHVEPWYVSTANVERDCVPPHASANKAPAVCRFSGANDTNMFGCWNSSGQPLSTCLLDGKQDPPIEFEQSHVAAALSASNAPVVHFFVGDTQAHSFTGSGWEQPAAVTALLGRILDDEIKAFGNKPENVVWTAGNNDGPHNAIFHAQDASTVAWAKALLDRSIVSDGLDGLVYDGGHGQTALFSLTGFYAKALPALGNHSYAIVLNTNLGGHNAVQAAALNTTLAWIARRHAAGHANVYLLGHHPSVMFTGTRCCGIPAAYRGFIKGVFAGHVHFSTPTTKDLFTQVGAITQDAALAESVGYFVAHVTPEAPSIILTHSDVRWYHGNGTHQPANASLWLT